MRIVFMGTPDFAVPCLARLIADGHEIAGVFTQPDKPKGRGYKLAPPPVKELALANFSVPPNSAFDLHAVTWFSFDFNEPARAETSTLRSNFHTADRHKARPDGSGSAHGTIAPSAREAPGCVRRRCI